MPATLATKTQLTLLNQNYILKLHRWASATTKTISATANHRTLEKLRTLKMNQKEKMKMKTYSLN